MSDRICTLCGPEAGSFATGAELRDHLREEHGAGGLAPVADELDDELAGDEGPPSFSAPRAPTPRARRTKTTPTKKAGRKAAVAVSVPIDQQIAMLYRGMAQVAGPRGYPATANILAGKSEAFGKAWDDFLRQFPAVYEMLEKGMIIGPTLTLVVMHVEVVSTMRQEVEARTQAAGAPAA